MTAGNRAGNQAGNRAGNRAENPAEQREDHFQRLKRLMAVEGEAEKLALLDALRRSAGAGGAAAETAGTTLVGLAIREQDAGMGGRILITLGKRSQTALPWTRLSPGTPVILSPEDSAGTAPGWRGIVSRVRAESIQVAFAEWPEIEDERAAFRLDRSPDEAARLRQRQALDRARAAGGSRLAELRDVLLLRREAVFDPLPDLRMFDQGLNDAQREAVAFALSARDAALLHGPPGTGKTTTLVELIRQMAARGQKVLAVAPSNLAVDNLLEKLLAAGVKAIRLGHPARVLPELRQHTLDLLVEAHPDMRLAARWVREAYALRGQAARFTRARPAPGQRQALRLEAKNLLADARKLEDQLVERLLEGAQVICATNTGLDRERFGALRFDCCVMDEASQSTEPGAWIPLPFADKLVLAGDPWQLPPTVVSPEAAAEGYAVSLMERLINARPAWARRLAVQYRMHRDIMTFSSREFYEGSLLAHDSVAGHLLAGLPGVAAGPLTTTPVIFVDTAGAGYDEAVESEGESRYNLEEAAQVLRYVQALLEAGLPPEAVAVIAPYAAQVRRLREMIAAPDLEVDSVDGFQGREKEAVVVSLVRSNPQGEIGFLADVRRMNVALTRARRKLIVIGDSATVTAHPFYRRMVEYFDAIGAYRSVWE